MNAYFVINVELKVGVIIPVVQSRDINIRIRITKMMFHRKNNVLWNSIIGRKSLCKNSSYRILVERR